MRVLVLLFAVCASGFKTRQGKEATHADVTRQGAVAGAKEVAKLWMSKTQAALSQQPGTLLKFLNASELPDLDHLRLAQEVRAFAEATRDRLLLEQKTGATERTHNENLRRVLDQLAMARGMSIAKYSNVTNGTVAKRTPLLAESTIRLVVAEALYIAATYGVATHMAAPTNGMIMLAMFYVTTVLIYMDAGWGLIDALHWSMEIPTTIGWGDMGLGYTGLTNTRPLEIWTTIHVAVSAVFVTSGMQSIANYLFLNYVDDEGHAKLGEMLDCDQDTLNVAISMLEWTFAISIGALFYAFMEHCTCSFGPSEVAGCDPLKCEETGGYKMDLVDAFYMMTVSATSVGYGDFAPKSYWGRAVGVPLFFLTIFINNHMAAATGTMFDAIFDH